MWTWNEVSIFPQKTPIVTFSRGELNQLNSGIKVRDFFMVLKFNTNAVGLNIWIDLKASSNVPKRIWTFWQFTELTFFLNWFRNLNWTVPIQSFDAYIQIIGWNLFEQNQIIPTSLNSVTQWVSHPWIKARGLKQDFWI